jgi:hypothetical protein
MTQEEFIKVLKKDHYSYEIEGDKIVVTYKDDVFFGNLTSLPTGVEFKNKGDVYLSALTSLLPGVKFRNKGHVYLGDLTSLTPGVEFRNKGHVVLKSLTSISPGVVFDNEENVILKSLIGGWFNDSKGNIKGIDNKRLLNLMIKRGMFI